VVYAQLIVLTLPRRDLGIERLNAVEIDEAISALAEQPFEPEEFPFAFLQAYHLSEAGKSLIRTEEWAGRPTDARLLRELNEHIAGGTGKYA
jgi:hypothetical protein